MGVGNFKGTRRVVARHGLAAEEDQTHELEYQRHSDQAAFLSMPLTVALWVFKWHHDGSTSLQSNSAGRPALSWPASLVDRPLGQGGGWRGATIPYASGPAVPTRRPPSAALLLMRRASARRMGASHTLPSRILTARA